MMSLVIMNMKRYDDNVHHVNNAESSGGFTGAAQGHVLPESDNMYSSKILHSIYRASPIICTAVKFYIQFIELLATFGP